MKRCISQRYVIVPCHSKATVKESQGFNAPESDDASSAVTVCGSAPLLVYVIVLRGSMAASAGSQKKSHIYTNHVFYTDTAHALISPWCSIFEECEQAKTKAAALPVYESTLLEHEHSLLLVHRNALDRDQNPLETEEAHPHPDVFRFPLMFKKSFSTLPILFSRGSQSAKPAYSSGSADFLRSVCTAA
jgi:hypothetical protein